MQHGNGRKEVGKSQGVAALLLSVSRSLLLPDETEGLAFRDGGQIRKLANDANGDFRAGRAEDLPARSLVAAIARPDGAFEIIY